MARPACSAYTRGMARALGSRTAKVEIAVTPSAAEMLEDENRRESIGELISALAEEDKVERAERLMKTLRDIGERARAAGLTDEIVDAELAAHKSERRS